MSNIHVFKCMQSPGLSNAISMHNCFAIYITIAHTKSKYTHPDMTLYHLHLLLSI